MSEYALTKEAAEMFRRRVEYEDVLLNTRTNIVLTLNGLVAVAASFTHSVPIRLSIVVVIIISNILWLWCALDARWFISKLSEELRRSNEIPADEAFRHKVQEGRLRIGTTRYMSTYLPGLLLVAWAGGLLLSIWFP
jgi:hypothetical protein